jgi:hypothetical protein
MRGYNSWLTTCALWRRIVDLMRNPAVALDWCQGGIRRLGLRDRDDWHDRAGRVSSLHRAIPTPSSHKAPIANSGRATVARSRILAARARPTKEDLLVLYLGRAIDPSIVISLVQHRGRRVTALNPYWEKWGVPIEDPDGYRLVVCLVID